MAGSFTFYLDEYAKGRFTAECTSNTPFDGTLLNQLMQPMSLAKIEKGTFSKLAFNIAADTTISSGHLLITYDGLKVSLLKRNQDEYRKKDIFSLLANVVVRNKNEEGKNMRMGNVQYKYNRYKSFFNYIWKTMFLNMRSVIVKI